MSKQVSAHRVVKPAVTVFLFKKDAIGPCCMSGSDYLLNVVLY